MQGSWIVTLPPLLVILSVLLTRRMILSFLLGISAAVLIAENGNIVNAAQLAVKKLWISSGLSKVTSVSDFFSSWNLLIFLFLIMLGILIVILSETGAAQAYVNIVGRKVKSKKGAEIASLILSFLFFIDDYFSALTVGSVMRPLAARYHVHPVKLAFLTTAMATPLTILSPISSWVGEIVLQLKQVGIGPAGPQTVIAADPYFVFVKATPYILYALILIISTWYIVLRGISFGPMKKYDTAHSVEQRPQKTVPTTSSFFDFIFPIALLVCGVFFMLLYTGDFYLFGGKNTFIDALKNASPHQALFTGGLVSLLVSTLYFILKGTLAPRALPSVTSQGFNLMFPSILMLICAWALGSLLKDDLQTGKYVATLVCCVITISFFPVICFLFSALIAWMIGSAWATIGLMFPIVINMLQNLLHLPPNIPLDQIQLIIPILGATLSGCVIGTHLSVISDNPIMSAASTGANHLEHVKTMAWYIIPVGISAGLGYVFIGTMKDSLEPSLILPLGIAVGILISLGLLELGNYIYSTK